MAFGTLTEPANSRWRMQPTIVGNRWYGPGMLGLNRRTQRHVSAGLCVLAGIGVVSCGGGSGGGSDRAAEVVAANPERVLASALDVPASAVTCAELDCEVRGIKVDPYLPPDPDADCTYCFHPEQDDDAAARGGWARWVRRNYVKRLEPVIIDAGLWSLTVHGTVGDSPARLSCDGNDIREIDADGGRTVHPPDPLQPDGPLPLECGLRVGEDLEG